jgi:lipoate---protein ligase
MADPGPIRLLDLGLTPPIRSQTIYHAVGYAMGPEGPDTILLVSPDQPYVSIGRHQDADREVDLTYCAEQGLPVIRREVGGGAVYLDHDQLFTQWVFHAERLPPTVEGRFARYAETLVGTYRALGIAAEYRPINDIQVTGRKIGGTGAARMDLAEVLVGSLMFDFDVDAMARVLKVPSEKFRDKVHQSLIDYMTTMRRELGEPPQRDQVIDAYLAACEAALGRTIERGELRPDELALAEQLDERFASQAWLEEAGGLHRPSVRIHQDVHVGEGMHKAPGGLIRCLAVLREDRLADVAFSGDFTVRPTDFPGQLAAALIDCPVRPDEVEERISVWYTKLRPEIPGVAPGDWAMAVLRAVAIEGPD